MTPKKETAKSAAKPAAVKKTAAAKKAVDTGHEITDAHFYAVGRRKRGIAQVRIYTAGKGMITVNKKPFEEYFPVEDLREGILTPLKAVGMDATADVVAETRGGGIRGQADAVKLGIARALLKQNPDFRATLKPLGVLTRDPREKERKKYGLKKARKAPQWAKR
jgi:small subunit ribosomal protein S9